MLRSEGFWRGLRLAAGSEVEPHLDAGGQLAQLGKAKVTEEFTMVHGAIDACGVKRCVVHNVTLSVIGAGVSGFAYIDWLVPPHSPTIFCYKIERSFQKHRIQA